MHQENEFLDTRRRALEEECFHQGNQRLIENLREKSKLKESKEALAEASGITNESILESLLYLGIEAETVSALQLVPLLEVVWSDGELDEKEKPAVLKAAGTSGLAQGSLSYALLESSLSLWPRPKLREAWRLYRKGLCKQLQPEERESLREDLLGRARAVAEASGVFLGVGSKILSSEAQVLEELSRASESNRHAGPSDEGWWHM